VCHLFLSILLKPETHIFQTDVEVRRRTTSHNQNNYPYSPMFIKCLCDTKHWVSLK